MAGIGGAGNGVSGEIGRSLLNSVIESGAAMILTVVIAIFAAYAFARLRFRFKRTIFVSVLATLLLPAYATLIPLYRIMASLGLVNTYLAVVLVYVSGFLPLAIWILYNYFNTIPRELEEAAFVDGASPMRALLRVVIPVAMPGIAAAAIIAFLLGWAQFLFPLILTTDLSTQPVTVIVAALNQQRIVPFTLLMACGVIAAADPGRAGPGAEPLHRRGHHGRIGQVRRRLIRVSRRLGRADTRCRAYRRGPPGRPGPPGRTRPWPAPSGMRHCRGRWPP